MGFKLFLIALVSIAAVAFAARLPNSNPGTFIIGGENATKNEFPWLVRFTVLPASGESRFCLGTLVDLNLVLTSASCVTGNSRPITVVAGDHLLLEDEGTEQSVASSEVFLHENFNKTGGLENDIAFIRLSSTLEETESVSAIELPKPNYDPVYYGFGIGAGWGETNETELSPILQRAWVDIREKERCGEHGFQIPEGQFCTIDEIGAYSGDTGGPLSCYGTPGKICGILSSTAAHEGTIMGSYTNVSQYLDWIGGYANSTRGHFQIKPLQTIVLPQDV
ncbi:Mast cell protease 1 [Orchesella cincta]|uniref:Mast cell protease 1 n=1 Tax=Orchesella cincta TaxID=48709 RepID=A0A1D2MKA8_ORCCI|nr:Mast cell protease 1 [Orchesella cincta]